MEAPTSGTEKKVYELEFDYRLVLRVAASSEVEAVEFGNKHTNKLGHVIQRDFFPSFTFVHWKWGTCGDSLKELPGANADDYEYEVDDAA